MQTTENHEVLSSKHHHLLPVLQPYEKAVFILGGETGLKQHHEDLLPLFH